MVDNEIKSAVEQLGSAFAEFKKTHQEELKQIKQKGSADVITSEKLSRIEQTWKWNISNWRIILNAFRNKINSMKKYAFKMNNGNCHSIKTL